MMWTLAVVVCLSGNDDCKAWLVRPITDQEQCLLLRNSVRRMWREAGFPETKAECFEGTFG